MDINATILTIDDSPTNQKLISKSLSSQYTVKQAMSGSEGIALLSSVKPQLILLDIDMPGLDGYQTCRAIRTQHQYDDVPILFVSCLTDPKDQIAAFAAGGDDYINKPVNLELLSAKVGLALNKLKNNSSSRPLFHPDAVKSDTLLSDILLQCIRATSNDEINAIIAKTLNQLDLSYALREKNQKGQTYTNISNLSTLEDTLLDQAESYIPMSHSSRYLYATSTHSLLLRNFQALDTEDRKILSQLIQKYLEAGELRKKQIEKLH